MKISRVVAVMMSTALLWTIGCAKDLVTGRQTMNWYSLSDDVKLGSKVMNAQIASLKKKEKKKKTVIVDAKKNREELKQLRRIVGRIKPVTHYPAFPYEVHLADMKVANAWCAPGGKIMVFTGLWDPKKGLIEKGNEAQLAAVLSHEIAHANARHMTEAVSRGMTIGLIGTAASTAVYAGGGAHAANAFGQVANLGFNLYFPMYTRDNEKEADRIGLMYMAKAGYDPRVAVQMWKRAAKKKGDRSSIFASHPASGERARYLEELLPEAMEYYNESKYKYEQPKKKR